MLYFNSSVRILMASTLSQWNQLANDAKGQGFGAIRITGFDCNALDLASSAAAAAGIQVLAGIFVTVSMHRRFLHPSWFLLTHIFLGHYLLWDDTDQVRHMISN